MQITGLGFRLLLASLGAFLLAVSAAEVKAIEKTDDIDTNRPSFMQSSLVVPNGSLQLENGTLYQHFQHGITYYDVPENQVRLGLAPKTEFQMFTPQFVLLNQGRSTVADATGLGEVGIKRQFGPYKRFVASFVGAVNIPTGTRIVKGTTIQTTAVQAVFRIPHAIQLTSTVSICGQQSLIVLDSHGDLLYEPFVMLTKSVGRHLSMFTEYAGFFAQNQHAACPQIAHFGAVYKLNRNNQIDIQFGFGLTKTAPTALVGCGYSYRFDHLPWGK